MPKVTLTYIAKQCGVTQPTVSRILNGKEQMHDAQTVKLVKSTADKLGYLPNNLARKMRTGQTFSIAMVQDTIAGRSSLPDELLRGIQKAIEPAGYSMCLTPLSDQKLSSEQMIAGVLSEMVADGVLLNFHGDVPENFCQILDKYHVPAVWINNHYKRNTIRPDDFKGAYDLTQKFIAMGHQKVVFFSTQHFYDHMHCSKTDRLEGYTSAMRDHGLMPIPVLGKLDAKPKEIVRLAENGMQDATAAVTYSGLDADFLMHNKSHSIFKDIAEIGTFDSEYRLYNLPVHKMIVPFRELGYCAGMNLLSLIQDKAKGGLKPFASQLIECKYLDHSGLYDLS